MIVRVKLELSVDLYLGESLTGATQTDSVDAVDTASIAWKWRARDSLILPHISLTRLLCIFLLIACPDSILSERGEATALRRNGVARTDTALHGTRAD